MKNYFCVENLCFGYIKKPLCLKDVNFSIEKNARVLVLALDDKGKTSLLKTLSGFDSHFFGKVTLDGKEIRTIPDEEKNVSVIFDEPILLNSTIEKNIDYVCEVIGRETLKQEEKIELLKQFNFTCELKTKIKKLSVFEKFKLCFLRVCIKNSRVLFVDDILKNNFNDEELEELKSIFELNFKNKTLFFTANNESFLKNRTFFEWLKPTKVLYLNNAKAFEKNSIEDFSNNIIDLDACEFAVDLEKIDGFCVYQEGSFYLSFQEKFVIKIDRNLNLCFEKFNLQENENEDIILVYKKSLELDLSKNNDFNKLLKEKKVMIFSKLDRSRVL